MANEPGYRGITPGRKLTPTHYTEAEGEMFREWTGDHVYEWELLEQWRKRHPAATVIWVHGVMFHAIRFQDGTVFDVRNGYRSDKWFPPVDRNTDGDSNA